MLGTIFLTMVMAAVLIRRETNMDTSSTRQRVHFRRSTTIDTHSASNLSSTPSMSSDRVPHDTADARAGPWPALGQPLVEVPIRVLFDSPLFHPGLPEQDRPSTAVSGDDDALQSANSSFPPESSENNDLAFRASANPDIKTKGKEIKNSSFQPLDGVNHHRGNSTVQKYIIQMNIQVHRAK